MTEPRRPAYVTAGQSSEHAEQAFVIAWARLQETIYPELRWLFAIPNGAKLPWKKDRQGRRYSPEAIKLKEEGLKSGVPDLCLPVPRPPFHGLFVEMKYGKNQPSPEQIEYLDALSGMGYCALVCWGADEAIAEIKSYLGIVEE
jgi:hypothetical protein